MLLILTGAGCFDFGRNKNVGTDGGVFKTVDQGIEWVQSVLVPTTQGVGTLATTNIIALEMDPQDEKVFYIGTTDSGMLYSLDGAASWQQPREKSLQEGAVQDIDVDPKNICRVFIAKGSRLYSTQDCLRSVDDEVYLDSRSKVRVMDVEVDWYDSNVIWIGLSNGDVLKSLNGGQNWKTVLNSKQAVSSIIVSNSDSRQVFVGTAKGLHITTDGGENFELLDDELKEFRNSDAIYDIKQSKDGSVVIAATKYGLVRSKDFGKTWEGIQLLTTPGQVTIRALAMLDDNPNNIFYATTGTFYRTNDAGVTWEPQTIPSNRTPRRIVVDPTDQNVLYVAVAAEQR